MTPGDHRDTPTGASRATSGTPVGQSGNRERTIIIGVAAAVTVVVAAYLGLRTAALDSGAGGTLMPYQVLLRDFVSSDQAMFQRLRQSLLDAEAVRAGTGQWPDAGSVASLPITSPSPDPSIPAPAYSWTRTQQGIIVNYLGLPGADASAAAWLIRIQEPDPLVPADRALNDEEHHRLPDGTVLHVSIWTHRFGGQMTPAFFPKPENAGWTQILTAPLAPLPWDK
jgi:hypothetical protein